jgi:hypothetical protein
MLMQLRWIFRGNAFGDDDLMLLYKGTNQKGFCQPTPGETNSASPHRAKQILPAHTARNNSINQSSFASPKS